MNREAAVDILRCRRWNRSSQGIKVTGRDPADLTLNELTAACRRCGFLVPGEFVAEEGQPDRVPPAPVRRRLPTREMVRKAAAARRAKPGAAGPRVRAEDNHQARWTRTMKYVRSGAMKFHGGGR